MRRKPRFAHQPVRIRRQPAKRRGYFNDQDPAKPGLPYLDLKLATPVEDSVFLSTTGDRPWKGERDHELEEYFFVNDNELSSFFSRPDDSDGTTISFTHCLDDRRITITRDASVCSIEARLNGNNYISWRHPGKRTTEWTGMCEIRIAKDSIVPLAEGARILEAFVYRADVSELRLASSVGYTL